MSLVAELDHEAIELIARSARRSAARPSVGASRSARERLLGARGQAELEARRRDPLAPARTARPPPNNS